MEHTTKRPLVLSTPPHVFDGITTQKVMLNVVIALVPTLIASFVIFGFLYLPHGELNSPELLTRKRPL